jgi:hypothetical protein
MESRIISEIKKNTACLLELKGRLNINNCEVGAYLGGTILTAYILLELIVNPSVVNVKENKLHAMGIYGLMTLTLNCLVFSYHELNVDE